MNTLKNRRILLVDDMPAIHEDFRKILAHAVAASELDEEEARLFGTPTRTASVGFELDSAYQGAQALDKVRAALLADMPYAMAFVDMRMPPGWDGVETIERLWKEDPGLQIVICTAYSDYSWTEVLTRLDVRDRLLILKKPFEAVEVCQMASALTEKWQMTQQAAFKMSSLKQAVEERTRELSDANIIVQNSPVILYRLRGEPSFPLTYISHNITKFGHDPATLLASPNWAKSLVDPDDQSKVDVAMARVLEKGAEGASIEFRLRTGDGACRWVENCYMPVRDKNGRLIEVEGFIIDITERKQTEQTLRESEERFRALTALSSDWFWEQDENFRFVQISGGAGRADLALATRDNSIGKTHWEIDHVNMDDSVWATHKAQLERHEAFRDFEVPRLDTKGQIRYESLSGMPIFDASGRFTGYRGTGRDTTEMRRVSDALYASELQLRQMTDTVPALIACLDREQRFRFHNKAYEEVFGLSFGQIDGHTLAEVLGQQAYAGARDKVEEVLRGDPVGYEHVQITPQGIRKDYAMQYVPRHGEGADKGKVIGFFALGTDITKLKRIDRMKTEFVSTVSHELRTPLTSIRGSLGLISGGVAGELPEAVKNLVGIAKNNCERLIRLINDILDSEKIESGKMRLDLQAVDIKQLVQQALAANEGFAGQHRVAVLLQAPDAPLQVRVDSDRMTQVLTNLLSNAVKFSLPQSAVKVKVSRVAQGVRVEVADRGPGIPEEFHGRIFQKFSQADASDTRQKGGTGLGLNISRALIEKMGGQIGFSSEAGVGTTFFFVLPEWQSPVPLLRPFRTQAASSRPRILICEDDPDVARLIGMMLGKAGFEAEMAYSAEQALVCLARSSYDAVTVDLKLPGQSGAAFIGALRDDERTRHLPVVVISALAEEGRLQFSRKPLMVSDWLQKPIDEDLLILSVRRAIAGLQAGKPRILHVEDDLDVQRITAAIAQDFANFEFAATLDEARIRLREQRFDLVLLDLALGKDSGWNLVEDIDALDPRPPMIVFSASDVDPADGKQAEAVLVKARTSNTELLNTIQRVLQIPGDPGPTRPQTLR